MGHKPDRIFAGTHNGHKLWSESPNGVYDEFVSIERYNEALSLLKFVAPRDFDPNAYYTFEATDKDGRKFRAVDVRFTAIDPQRVRCDHGKRLDEKCDGPGCQT